MRCSGTEMWGELNTGHSEVEALGRLENPSLAKQLLSSSPLPFIPVNMLHYLWKGLIQRLFCGIMTVYSTSCQSRETKEWQKKSIREELIVCFQVVMVHLRRTMNTKEGGFTHFTFTPQVAWCGVSPPASPLLELQTLVSPLLSKISALIWQHAD